MMTSRNYNLINKIKFLYKKLAIGKKIKKIFTVKKNIYDRYKYIYFETNQAKLIFSGKENIKVLWFIPDVSVGSGGHLNIFRMIDNLAQYGIKSDIAICGESKWVTNNYAKEIIDKHFFNLESKVVILKSEQDIKLLDEYEIAMATSWSTAYYVNSFNKCCKKTYFVQDFEPYFYAHGSNYSFAENTYKFGFYGITAGSWLTNKLNSQYDMECDYFSFSYDREFYSKKIKQSETRKVFFYARPPTDRRGFELGLLVLNKLYKLNPDIEIILAGYDTSAYYLPFRYTNPGIVSLDKLSSMYAECDVALVLSYTNLSLLPLELLASGCPVVINDSENNSWIDPKKELFIYAKDNTSDIVNKLDDVLNKKIKYSFDISDKFLEKTSWKLEAEKVNNILKGILVNK